MHEVNAKCFTADSIIVWVNKFMVYWFYARRNQRGVPRAIIDLWQVTDSQDLSPSYRVHLTITGSGILSFGSDRYWLHNITSTIIWSRPRWAMVFNVTFSNISDISWRLALLVQETGVPRKTHRPVASRHWQTLSYNVVSRTPRHEWGSNPHL
jgi:hypothetical protein